MPGERTVGEGGGAATCRGSARTQLYTVTYLRHGWLGTMKSAPSIAGDTRFPLYTCTGGRGGHNQDRRGGKRPPAGDCDSGPPPLLRCVLLDSGPPRHELKSPHLHVNLPVRARSMAPRDRLPSIALPNRVSRHDPQRFTVRRARPPGQLQAMAERNTRAVTVSIVNTLLSRSGKGSGRGGEGERLDRRKVGASRDILRSHARRWRCGSPR